MFARRSGKHLIELGHQTWSTPLVTTADDGEPLIVLADRGGELVAYSGNSLDTVWKVNLGAVITASPVDAGGPDEARGVIIGSESGRVVRVNLHNGRVQWERNCGTCVRSTAAVVKHSGGQRVFISGYGAWMYCLEAASGAVVWKKYLPKQEYFGGTKSGIVSSPLVADVDLDGELEVVTGTRSRRVYCLSAETGHFKWFYETGYDPDSSPSFAVVDGMPLVFIGAGETTSGLGDKSVYALAGDTGEVYWRTPVLGGLDSSPVIADINKDGKPEVVITSLADASCYAMDAANGEVVWKYRFGPTEVCHHDEHNVCRKAGTERYYTGHAVCRSYTTPLIIEGRGASEDLVIVGSNNGTLVALSGKDGNPVWQDSTRDMVRGSPIFADIDGDGQSELLVCSGSRVIVYSSSLIGSRWPMFKGTADHMGWLGARLPEPGSREPRRQRYLWARLIWYWLVKDFFRYLAFHLERRILSRLGIRLSDYYY